MGLKKTFTDTSFKLEGALATWYYDADEVILLLRKYESISGSTVAPYPTLEYKVTKHSLEEGDLPQTEYLGGFFSWVLFPGCMQRFQVHFRKTALALLTDPESINPTQPSDKVTSTESILGEFGFSIDWTVSPFSARFVVYQLDNEERDDNTVVLQGSIKWDACVDIQPRPQRHYCQAIQLERENRLIQYLYERSFALMKAAGGTPDPEAWPVEVRELTDHELFAKQKDLDKQYGN